MVKAGCKFTHKDQIYSVESIYTRTLEHRLYVFWEPCSQGSTEGVHWAGEVSVPCGYKISRGAGWIF